MLRYLYESWLVWIAIPFVVLAYYAIQNYFVEMRDPDARKWRGLTPIIGSVLFVTVSIVTLVVCSLYKGIYYMLQQ